MVLQSTGAISLLDIATEFGGTTPHSVSEYYAQDSGIPGTGPISFSDFYGKQAQVDVTASAITNQRLNAGDTRYGWRYQNSGSFFWSSYTSGTTTLGIQVLKAGTFMITGQAYVRKDYVQPNNVMQLVAGSTTSLLTNTSLTAGSGYEIDQVTVTVVLSVNDVVYLQAVQNLYNPARDTFIRVREIPT